MNQVKQTPNYTFALIVVFIVCFLIGFITTMNNSMIGLCSKAFNLTAQQGQYINTAFYGAYIFAIPFSFLMSKIGYKGTLLLGLAVAGIGFIINSLGINGVLDKDVSTIYAVFLGSMCVVAMGVVMLQNVANPYVMVLGTPEKGAFRMTLSQALNSVATTVAPLFITHFIFTQKDTNGDTIANGADIPAPFLGLGIFTLVICLILVFLKLPKIDEGKQSEDVGEKLIEKDSVFKYPHVWLGALGIFMYMGVEIGVPSMLPNKFKVLGLGDATSFLTFYWGGMMIGRFIGAAILTKFEPRKLLSCCIGLGALCIAASLVLPGMWSVWFMLAAGLFHSVMWPLVFNLGLQKLGRHTKAASGIINTGVIGAALLTPVMGWVVDSISLATGGQIVVDPDTLKEVVTPTMTGVTIAVSMMFIYYVYLIWFCWKGSKIGLK
jgi:FHS family L-fucose permease-like MFS transporter